jgi:signal transduction histidine kinase
MGISRTSFGPDLTRMRSRYRQARDSTRFWALLLFAAAASVVFGLHLSAVLDTVIVLAATSSAGIVFALSTRSRERRWVAFPLTLAAVAWTVGWAFWQGHILSNGIPPAAGSPADIMLIGYPLIALALLRLERRRSAMPGRSLDVAILIAATVNLSWLFLIGPYVIDNASLPIHARGVQAAYMLCDVLIFVGVARLATTAWPQPRSTVLMTLGGFSLLAADIPWSWMTLVGVYDGAGSITDAGIPFSFALFALGIRELRLRELRPVRRATKDISWGHIALLGGAMIVVPVALVAFRGPSSTRTVTIIVEISMMVLVSSLVFARLVRLLAHERRDHLQEAQRRELLADNNELRDLDMLKDQFIATVSHELRTPLTSIRGYVELLLSANDLSDEHRQLLSVVDRNSDRLLRLVGDLLFVAQVDAGKLSLSLEPMTIDQVAWDCVQSLKPVAAEQGIELALDLRPTPPVDGDGARLAQVLDNLVGNAIKFTSAGKRIELRLRNLDDHLLIEVADQGAGISTADQTRLFNRFFRSAFAAEQAISGSGLGLAISKALVEAHGGTIGVESTQGVGSTFWVKLPYAVPLAAAA